ncbi:Gabbr2, partial [Symbiodinium sp. KB8]
MLFTAAALQRITSTPAFVLFHAMKPGYYKNGDCTVDFVHNPGRNASQVISPYTGIIGDMMTMAEPLLALAAQEIEDSGWLPGYRVNLHLTDSGCDEEVGPDPGYMQKHAILGDSCSQACAAVADAARLFKVLMVSPGCDSPSLSDRSRYPYLTRMTPSDRFKVTAVYEVMKMFSFHRVGVMDGPFYTQGAKDFFLELIQRDLDAGTYGWTVLLDRTVGSPADAISVADDVLARDSRINLMVLPEYMGMWVLCQFFLRDMLPPDQRISESRMTVMALMVVGSGRISGRSPIQSTSDLHGLSGTRLSEISNYYNTACQQFANGQGACDYVWTGYFYDGLWHLVSLLHTYLIQQNHSAAELGTASSRSALYELSLQQDYVGLTGRVRQFNTIEPTTVPPSYGDRDGVQLIRQITGGTGNEFSELAYRTGDGVWWLRDLQWSPFDNNKVVPCSTGVCSLGDAFVPTDRINQCPAGSVFSVQLGCVDCGVGRYATVGMTECDPCDVGTFANQTGRASCHPCTAGSFNNILGAEGCELCGKGFFANETEETDCAKCPIGQYGPQKGLDSRSAQPGGTFPKFWTTGFSGAVDQEACQCQGELYQGTCISCAFNTRYEAGQCLPCSEGLRCDGSSTAEVDPGYYADPSAPFDVYKCLPQEFCIGGSPGACAGGREGIPCTQCPEGQAWAAGACEDCTSLSLAGWLAAGLAGMLAIPALYYMMNMKQTAKATTMLATSCALAMTISMLQNVGIVGYISFSWPSELQWMFDLMSLFTLDLQAAGFDCVSSSPVASYHMTAAMLPCALLWLIVCSLLSKLLPARWQFESAKVVSTLGQFVQVSFTIYSKVALSPMMCYTHPNGKSGMLEHNGFYALAIWATIVAPSKASGGSIWFLTATKFLLFRFRSLMLSLSIVAAGDSPYVQVLQQCPFTREWEN